jgi:methyl-accepting chemotaxis protein
VQEKLPPALRPIVDRAIGRVHSLRSYLRDRIAEVNRMTQREVMSAAQDVNTIYTSATTQIADLKSRLSAVATTESSGKDVSAERQLTAVEGYVHDLETRVDQLNNIAHESAGCTSKIEDAAQQIQRLSTDAHMLAINARIEAARDSVGSSRGFAVIAVEMKQLSRLISATSENVKTLARTLGALLPQMADGMTELRQQSNHFSTSLAGDIRNLAERSAAQRREVEAALSASDDTLGAIVRASQSALSHLQFQDVVAQGLMRVDANARETEIAVCTDLDAEDRISEVDRAMHVEIGGDKTVDAEDAGKVLLF